MDFRKYLNWSYTPPNRSTIGWPVFLCVEMRNAAGGPAAFCEFGLIFVVREHTKSKNGKILTLLGAGTCGPCVCRKGAAEITVRMGDRPRESRRVSSGGLAAPGRPAAAPPYAGAYRCAAACWKGSERRCPPSPPAEGKFPGGRSNPQEPAKIRRRRPRHTAGPPLRPRKDAGPGDPSTGPDTAPTFGPTKRREGPFPGSAGISPPGSARERDRET